MQRQSGYKKSCTPDQAFKKLERFCAYQDRCHQEVRSKLYDLGLYGADVDQVMARLIEDRYLDEERFARSFARGKFRMKSWGRMRITSELKQRDVSSYCIRKALEEIDEAAYENALRELMLKRLQSSRSASLDSDYARQQDLIRLAYRKGFESELAQRVAQELVA